MSTLGRGRTSYPAVITDRTSDVPASAETVRYSAASEVGEIEAPSVVNAIPYGGRPFHPSFGVGRIIPCEIGDPCELRFVRGRWVLIVQTEYVEYGLCDEASQ